MPKNNFLEESALEGTAGSGDNLLNEDSASGVGNDQQKKASGENKSSRPISKLRSLRRAEGYTLEQLSQLTSISPSYLSRLEAGDRRLNTDLIHRLAEVFQCSPADLLQASAPDESLHSSSSPLKNRRFVFQKDLPIYKVGPAEEVGNVPAMSVNDKPLQLFLYDDVPIDWAYRPAQLAQAPSGFAVYLSDSQFAPKYDEGELLLVHPSKPLTKDCTVLAVNQNNSIALGQFEGWAGDTLYLSSYSFETAMPQEITLSKTELKALYRVIGTLELS